MEISLNYGGKGLVLLKVCHFRGKRFVFNLCSLEESKNLPERPKQFQFPVVSVLGFPAVGCGGWRPGFFLFPTNDSILSVGYIEKKTFVTFKAQPILFLLYLVFLKWKLFHLAMPGLSQALSWCWQTPDFWGEAKKIKIITSAFFFFFPFNGMILKPWVELPFSSTSP